MDSFDITPGLTLEKHLLGAMVNYIAFSGQGGDAFHVGLSVKSLKACLKALTRHTASWECSDGSLRVAKREGEVTLVFKMQGPSHESWDVVLKGGEVAKFEEAVAQLAAG